LGPVDGGTLVTVSGSDLVDTAELRCLFGARLAVATFVTDTRVHCTAPAQSAAGTVVVQVSNNGADFAAAPGTFLYHGALVCRLDLLDMLIVAVKQRHSP
jgi:hypothetical protein